MVAYTTICILLLRSGSTTAFTQIRSDRVASISRISIESSVSRLRKRKSTYNHRINLAGRDNEASQVPSTGGGLVPPFSVTLDDATAYSYKDAVMRTLLWVSAAFVFGSGLAVM